jgi:exodeoxyribonuclease V gamma subunit
LQGELPLGSFGTLMQQNFRQKAEQVVEQFKTLLQTWGEPQEQPMALDAIPCKLPNGDTIVLQDWLTDVRIHKSGTSHCAVITTRPSAVLDKAGKIKHHYLIRLWVQHVVAHAAGRTLTSYLVGEDRIIVLEPLADTAMALNCLNDWVTAWYIGQQEPLPVARKTAFAWLTAEKDKDDKAREAYEEGYQSGEVDTDAYLQRAYPTADDLLTARVQGQGFEYWVEQLYQPLLQVARVLETT